jgi:hypothetical protein
MCVETVEQLGHMVIIVHAPAGSAVPRLGEGEGVEVLI